MNLAFFLAYVLFFAFICRALHIKHYKLKPKSKPRKSTLSLSLLFLFAGFLFFKSPVEQFILWTLAISWILIVTPLYVTGALLEDRE